MSDRTTVKTGLVDGMFEFQTPARLNQAAPDNGTYYDILPATDHVRVYQIHVNIEDTNETLEVQATIDGEVLANTHACTHSTSYPIDWYGDAITRAATLEFDTVPTHFGRYRAFLLEGHNVQIEVRKTTAAGAGNLTGVVLYGVLRKAV